MNTRLTVLKTVLWTIVGVLAVVTLARFFRGLGSTTGLTDLAPWGFWIAFDVMAGVALAAGGFVVAAMVHIFGRQAYRPFARPAILTAFLGYVAVVVGLLYDLGLPWHIWHPMIFPQVGSVLFEVAMCVMLYLTVLALEFGPVVLEHPLLQQSPFVEIAAILKWLTIPLVIAGIVLSTLHQSSLGSLFLIAPYRLHALWYTPIIWVLFFVSAIGLGLMTVVAESFFSAAFFGHRLRMDLLSGLGRAASGVLFLYAGLRLADLTLRGLLGSAFDGSWQAYLFWFELLMSALVPATLLAVERVRSSAAGLACCSLLTILGVAGYRFDVCIVAFARPEGMSYFPTWPELAVSLGVVSAMVLVFIFFIENFRVCEHEPEESEQPAARPLSPLDPYDPGTMICLLPDSIRAPRRYSLAFVVGASLAITMLPDDALWGAQAKGQQVSPVRAVDGLITKRADAPGHELALATHRPLVKPGAETAPLLMIDGNRDGRLVLFPHKSHISRLGEQRSCARCHHQNMPFDRNTVCWQCHRDMYSTSDIFSHASHLEKLGGNASCLRCHKNSREARTRKTATACRECHKDMVVEGSFVKPPEGGVAGLACGYLDAMHKLCIECHERSVQEKPNEYTALARCATCHRGLGGPVLRQMPPYATDLQPKPEHDDRPPGR